MRRHLMLLFFILTIFCLAVVAQQGSTLDVIYLKNGNIIRGTITERIPGESVTIQTRDGNVFMFTFDEIQKITREKTLPGEREYESGRTSFVAQGMYVSKGTLYIGPSVGFSFLGSAPEFGANCEYGIRENVGVGVLVRYWKYSEDFIFSSPAGTEAESFNYSYSFSYSNILVAGMADYHFKIDVERLDPFVGVIVGYDRQSATWGGAEAVPEDLRHVSEGGFVGTAFGAVRYFLRDNLALVARFGYGSFSYGTLEVGVDLRL
jgi:hypothetical protein